MFIKAFITMVAADAVDRHLREQQHQAWIAQEQARREAAAREARAMSQQTGAPSS